MQLKKLNNDEYPLGKNDSFISYYLSLFLYYIQPKNFYLLTKRKVNNFYSKHKACVNCFLTLFICSILIVLITWFVARFTVPLNGDYNLQSMTFNYLVYDIWHDFFRTGNFPLWDNRQFLGMDNLGTNSFYFLFDPWYIITLIFPRNWQMSLQGLLFPMKFVVGGMGMYFLLNKLGHKHYSSTIGAIAYAFSGWSLMYLWFHFLDTSCFFPFVLLGIEKVLDDRNPSVLVFFLTLIGFSNFFFFYVFVLGAFIYAIWRIFVVGYKDSRNENIERLGLGFVGFFLPILTCSIVLLPAFVHMQGMPRVDSSSYLDSVLNVTSFKDMLKSLFVFENRAQSVYPLSGFLFMPLSNFYQNVGNVNYFDNFSQNSYITAGLILVSFYGYIEAIRKRKCGTIVAGLLIIAMFFTPFFYYLFSLFTVGYSRFIIVPLTFIIIFVSSTLNDFEKGHRSSWDISFGFLIFLDFLCLTLLLLDRNNTSHNNAYYYNLRYILIPIEMAVQLLAYLLIRFFYFKEKKRKQALFYITCLEFVVAGNVAIFSQGFVLPDYYGGGYENIYKTQDIATSLKEIDNTYYRVYDSNANRNNPNLNLSFGFNALGLFNSSYTFNLYDFLNNSRIPFSYGNWSMGYNERRPVLDNLFGVKYYLLDKNDKNVPYGFENIETLNESDNSDFKPTEKLIKQLHEANKTLYSNKNFINLLFPFDSVISKSLVTQNYYTREQDVESYYLGQGIVEKEDTLNYKISPFVSTSSNRLPATRYSIPTNRILTYLPKTDNGYYVTCSSNDYDCKVKVENKATNIDNLYVSMLGITGNYEDGQFINSITSSLFDQMIPKTKILYDFSDRPLGYGLGSYYVNVNLSNTWDVKFYGEKAYQELTKNLTNESSEYLSTELEPINHGTFDTTEFKFAHGYNLNEPAYYVVMELKNNVKNISNIQKLVDPFYVTSHNSLDAYLAPLKEANKQTKILSYTSDKIEFETHFTKNKFVMLNIPYTESWKLTKVSTTSKGEVIEDDVELFDSTYGFLSYVDNVKPSGVVEEKYILEYKPKYLKIGKVMTFFGTFLSLSIYCFYSDIKSKEKIYKSRYLTLKNVTNDYLNYRKKL